MIFRESRRDAFSSGRRGCILRLNKSIHIGSSSPFPFCRKIIIHWILFLVVFSICMYSLHEHSLKEDRPKRVFEGIEKIVLLLYL